MGISTGKPFIEVPIATRCFPSGVARYDKEPIFQNNLLVYNDMYYQIGEEHKEFCAEKTQDEDGAMVITQRKTAHRILAT